MANLSASTTTLGDVRERLLKLSKKADRTAKEVHDVVNKDEISHAAMVKASKEISELAEELRSTVSLVGDTNWPPVTGSKDDTLGNSVVLNVGGVKFKSSLDILRSEPGSVLHEMFADSTAADQSEEYPHFINRDGSLFRYLLDYLGTKDEEISIPQDEALRRRIIEEARWFQMGGLVCTLQPKFFGSRIVESYLLTEDDILWLNSHTWRYGRIFGLLYRCSWDSDEVKRFHEKCDGKGPTVVVVEDLNGAIFGGFTSSCWASQGTYSHGSDSFLFKLARGRRDKFSLKEGQAKYAICNEKLSGPAFGSGHDLHIANQCTQNLMSFSCGRSYDLEGSIAGSRNFRVKEYEIFLVG